MTTPARAEAASPGLDALSARGVPQPAAVAIGFIGTGIMGRSMAGHLQAAGHPLHVHNRTRSKAEPLLAAGGRWHDRPGDVAEVADVVITMLGFPQDVEEVILGAGGVVSRARPGTLVIDMTTSSPALAARIAAAAAAREIDCLDAPVSGGDIGARNATLVIMAGGTPAAFARALPLLERLGSAVTLLGPAGSGQRCKLANQIAVAVGMVAWCEALAHARAGGLDPAVVQRVIAGGAAGSWALTNLAPRALAGDNAPGFLVRHLVKDLRLAREAAADSGVAFPGLETAERLYARLLDLGHGDDGTQALYGLS
jgi:3-hydroxyisobutyrate dehydrogenase